MADFALKQTSVAGIATELITAGTGRPLLFLHPGDGLEDSLPFLDGLSDVFRVVAPSHPGFGATELPRHVTTVDDLSYFYLDLLDALELDKVILVGCSFGGWIALELATKCCTRVSHMVLVGSVGVKFKGREEREITDLFSITETDLPAYLRADPAPKRNYGAMSAEQVTRIVRDRESFSLFGWSPTLFSPKLRNRLHRARVPAHLIWGGRDKVVSVDYGRELKAALPLASMEVVPDAGHYAHLDRPDLVRQSLASFLNSSVGAMSPANQHE